MAVIWTDAPEDGATVPSQFTATGRVSPPDTPVSGYLIPESGSGQGNSIGPSNTNSKTSSWFLDFNEVSAGEYTLVVHSQDMTAQAQIGITVG